MKEHNGSCVFQKQYNGRKSIRQVIGKGIQARLELAFILEKFVTSFRVGCMCGSVSRMIRGLMMMSLYLQLSCLIDDGYFHVIVFAFLANSYGDIVLVSHRALVMVCSIGDLGKCHYVLFADVPRKVDFRFRTNSTTLISSLQMRIW